MNALFKTLLIATPCLALVFYYVVSQQAKQDAEMKVEDTKFERNWNEMSADMAGDSAKAKYQKRAEEEDEALALAKAELKKKEEKQKKMEAEMDQALKEYEDAAKKQEGKK